VKEEKERYEAARSALAGYLKDRLAAFADAQGVDELCGKLAQSYCEGFDRGRAWNVLLGQLANWLDGTPEHSDLMFALRDAHFAWYGAMERAFRVDMTNSTIINRLAQTKKEGGIKHLQTRGAYLLALQAWIKREGGQ
jgi:hypothetical protein